MQDRQENSRAFYCTTLTLTLDQLTEGVEIQKRNQLFPPISFQQRKKNLKKKRKYLHSYYLTHACHLSNQWFFQRNAGSSPLAIITSSSCAWEKKLTKRSVVSSNLKFRCYAPDKTSLCWFHEISVSISVGPVGAMLPSSWLPTSSFYSSQNYHGKRPVHLYIFCFNFTLLLPLLDLLKTVWFGVAALSSLKLS